MECAVEDTRGNGIVRGILGVVETRGEVDFGIGEIDILETR